MVVLLVWSCAGLLWPSTVDAHPFGAKFYSYQLTAGVEVNSLDVTVVSEIPTTQVMKEFFLALEGAEPDKEADARFTKLKLAELLEGVQVVVDGAEVTPENVTPKELKNGVGNSTFFTYTLNLKVPFGVNAGQAHTVSVINRNKTGGAAYYRNGVTVGEGLTLTDSTHWVAANDPAVQASKGWSRDTLQRDLVLTVKGLAEENVAQTLRSDPATADKPPVSWQLWILAAVGALSALLAAWLVGGVRGRADD